MSEYGCDICGGLGYTVPAHGKRRAGEQNLQMRDHPPKQDAHGVFWAGRSAGQLHIRDIPNAGVLATGRKTGGGEVFDRLEGQVVFIGGSPGTGKTHLCTAICAKLMDGGIPVRYVQWRGDIPAIKAKVNDAEAYARSHAAAENRPCAVYRRFSQGERNGCRQKHRL